MAMRPGIEIEIEFDEAAKLYFAMWEPVVIGAGDTQYKALNDLKQAAHFGIDAMINLKLKDIVKQKED